MIQEYENNNNPNSIDYEGYFEMLKENKDLKIQQENNNLYENQPSSSSSSTRNENTISQQAIILSIPINKTICIDTNQYVNENSFDNNTPTDSIPKEKNTRSDEITLQISDLFMTQQSVCLKYNLPNSSKLSKRFLRYTWGRYRTIKNTSSDRKYQQKTKKLCKCLKKMLDSKIVWPYRLVTTSEKTLKKRLNVSIESLQRYWLIIYSGPIVI
ncbi:hypothetical protein PPL_12484 [Heterostelium album PN500]|uniref:Uncharacterized protein n=1 Tax=Heterostelium pallidum (strain ATCC 26659 / Pp 5 / PN500) TaxID=670386 RepID=D3BMR1_HETP5|nr:hypothetical protein PPL_12484 [Heterostelium album PN500]EFA77273.1 hypothetical protein PPL_12484 [Heterostelium album PN500]|eukprot:XP_020429402.1 hypothetical protein PPL_12484 [Heterostelium album PN500]